MMVYSWRYRQTMIEHFSMAAATGALPRIGAWPSCGMGSCTRSTLRRKAEDMDRIVDWFAAGAQYEEALRYSIAIDRVQT